MEHQLGDTFDAARRLRRELGESRHLDERSRRYLSQIARAMDVGVVLLDNELAVDFASERARELLAADAEELDRRWSELCAAHRELFARAARQDAKREEIDVVVEPTSRVRRTVRLSVQRFSEQDEKGYLVLIRDSQTVRALEHDLQLAARLRGLMGLFMGLTHDLKAPLNAMVLNLELLKRSLVGDAPPGDADAQASKTRRRLEILETELQRLERSLERLLAQTAPPRPEYVRYDAGELVGDVGELLAPQARQQKVALEVHTPPERLPTRGYPDLTKQALINLAVNGFEAQPAGGTMHIDANAEDGEIVIRVCDGGQGIAPEVQDRIFELHFTTKETGTGLGLYVTRTLVESQGGKLWLAHTGPDGTAFELRLPADQEA